MQIPYAEAKGVKFNLRPLKIVRFRLTVPYRREGRAVKEYVRTTPQFKVFAPDLTAR